MQKFDLGIFNGVAEREGHFHIALDSEGTREKQRVAIKIALDQCKESGERATKYSVGTKWPLAGAEERQLRTLDSEVQQKMKWKVSRFHRDHRLSLRLHPLGKLRMTPGQRLKHSVEEWLKHG
jgi:hypothetical protein